MRGCIVTVRVLRGDGLPESRCERVMLGGVSALGEATGMATRNRNAAE